MAKNDSDSYIKRVLIVLVFCLLPGLFLFVLDQLLMHHLQGQHLPLFLSALYVVPFFILTFVAVIVVHLLSKRYDDNRVPYILFITALVLSVLTFVFSVIGVLTFTSLTTPAKGALLLGVVGIGLMATGCLWSRSGKPSGFYLYALLLALVLIFIAWAVIMPEWLFTQGSYPSVLMLFLFIALIYALRRYSAVPFFIELSAVVILFVTIAFIDHNHVQEFCGPNELSSTDKVESNADRPNIILIVWDTVRSDHLSAYGYERETTPYLSEIAKRDFKAYKNVISNASSTLSSHASMFTGLYPTSHGSHGFYKQGMDENSRDYHPLSRKLETLAEILKKKGYKCGGVSANYAFAGRGVNMDQGFHYFCDRGNPLYLKTGYVEFPKNIIELLKKKGPSSLDYPFFVPHITADLVNKLALKWIDGNKDDQPFFLFINYMEAHYPYYAPSDLLDAFDGYKKSLHDESPERLLCSDGEVCSLTAEQKAHLEAQYDSCILYLDMKLREFEQALRKKGLYEDTMIILTSDHGEAFGEHKNIYHGYSLYSELIHVPLLIKYRRRRSPDGPASVSEIRDVYRIVLERAGLAGEISYPTYSWKAMAERYKNFDQSDCECLDSKTQKAFYFDQYKYMATVDGEEELINMRTDYEELNDLSQKNPGALNQGRQLMEEFSKTVPEADIITDPQKLSPAEKEKLKALGYLH